MQYLSSFYTIHANSEFTYYAFIVLIAVIIDVVLNFTIGLLLKQKFSDTAVTVVLTIVTILVTIPLAVYVIPNFVTY